MSKWGEYKQLKFLYRSRVKKCPKCGCPNITFDPKFGSYDMAIEYLDLHIDNIRCAECGQRFTVENGFIVPERPCGDSNPE